MKQTQKKWWQKPLQHFKTWQLALILLFSFGGVVFATFSLGGADFCRITDGFSAVGQVCFKLLTTGADSEITFEVKPANTSAEIGGDSLYAGLEGKKLKFTNESGRQLFLPVRSTRELDSFLGARNGLSVDVCEVDGSGSWTGVEPCADGGCLCSVFLFISLSLRRRRSLIKHIKQSWANVM